jgi:hypothetical protein
MVSGQADRERLVDQLQMWDSNRAERIADWLLPVLAEVRRDALAPVHELADELEAVAETLDVTGDHTIAALTRPIAERIREAAGGAE